MWLDSTAPTPPARLLHAGRACSASLHAMARSLGLVDQNFVFIFLLTSCPNVRKYRDKFSEAALQMSIKLLFRFSVVAHVTFE